MQSLRNRAGTGHFKAGSPPSSSITVVREAPPAVRELAEELDFETNNPQLRIQFRDRVLYAHDFVNGTEEGFEALNSFHTAQVIDGTNAQTSTHVDVNDPDLAILKERVQAWKKMWTPHCRPTRTTRKPMDMVQTTDAHNTQKNEHAADDRRAQHANQWTWH